MSKTGAPDRTYKLCSFIAVCYPSPPINSNPKLNTYINTSPTHLWSLCNCEDLNILQSCGGFFTMKLVIACWLALLDAFNSLTGTPTDRNQQSLGFSGWPGHGHVPDVPNHIVPTKEKNPLVFPPSSPGEGDEHPITCDYTAMGAGWKACSSENDRGCWLGAGRYEKV